MGPSFDGRAPIIVVMSYQGEQLGLVQAALILWSLLS